MRLLHTADIHLDRSYAGLELPPAQGNENRARLQTVFETIMHRAATWPANALVITGDLFEYGRVTRATVNLLRESLAAIAPVNVVICPGRHDPCLPDSPYRTESWPENVHIFTTPAWDALELDGVPLTLHGFGWETPDHDGLLPPAPEIPADGRVHLAFGYGLEHAILHAPPPEPARLEAGIALPPGVSYLGLGGYHTTSPLESPAGMPVWFAGAPEGHRFEDHGPHLYLEIEIATGSGASGAEEVSVRPREVSRGRFQHLTLDATPFTTGQELLDAARGQLAAPREDGCVRLTLEGALIRPIYDELDGIRDALAAEVAYLQWHDACQVGEDYADLATGHTSLGAFIRRMNAEIGDAPNRAIRVQRQRSRDLGLCACRGADLPIRGLTGAYR